MLQTTRKILHIARNHIANPDSWWSRQLAETLGRDNLPPNWRNRRCAYTMPWRPWISTSMSNAEQALARACGSSQYETAFNTITHFNDTHTHAEVLAAFDRAISEREQ